MREVIAVAVGGAAGSVLRYWLSHLVQLAAGRGFPLGTLAVNLVGSFTMGALFILLLERHVAPEWRALWLVGVLGGFTTFSTFSLETVLLFQRGEAAKALINVLASVIVCTGAAFLGYAGARIWLNQGT